MTKARQVTKQTDRLLTLEINQKTIKDDVSEIKRMLGDYIKEAQEGRVDCNREMSSTSTQTKMQWGVLTIIIGGLIGLFIKK